MEAAADIRDGPPTAHSLHIQFKLRVGVDLQPHFGEVLL
jgi:hypothetical protein